MALDVNYCNRQADRLSDCASQLSRAKRKLSTNKTTLNSVWNDRSVNKINRKFDNVIKDINDAINECYTIRNNIKAAAKEVRDKELKQEQK
ncbi:MAG: hypothetical protein V8Q75_04295 [Bacilli bacterium]